MIRRTFLKALCASPLGLLLKPKPEDEIDVADSLRALKEPNGVTLEAMREGEVLTSGTSSENTTCIWSVWKDESYRGPFRVFEEGILT